MNRLRNLLALCLAATTLLSSGAIAQQSSFVAGSDYEVMSSQSSAEPVVEEFFNYACGGCYGLESFMTDFKSKNPSVKVKPIPLELRPAWKIYVKAYYLGEKLGVLDQSHPKIFHRIHVEKKYFADDADMKAFFLALGVGEKAYDDVASSYWLDTQLRLSKQYAMKNRVMSTPILLVNKRFKLNAREIGMERLEQAIVELSGTK